MKRLTLSDKNQKICAPKPAVPLCVLVLLENRDDYIDHLGTDFGTSSRGMLDTFPKAFETYWPGLECIDLLVNARCGWMYLLRYSQKIKRRKNFGGMRSTAPPVEQGGYKAVFDPKSQNNVIPVGRVPYRDRPKIHGQCLNLNACVIGSSGSGKTRFWLTPGSSFKPIPRMWW